MILFKPAIAENDYIDKVDLGNSLSESSHSVIGRGWAESPQFNPYTSHSGDKSKRYMNIGEDCSLDMHIKELDVPYTLNFEVEDGNCDDSFRVLVDGKETYVFTGQNKGTGNVEAKSHYAAIPKEYAINPILKITFKNTASDKCGKAAVYNVKILKGTLGQSLRGAIPEPPKDFFVWRDQAVIWANKQEGSRNWYRYDPDIDDYIGWCLNFVACAFEQDDKGTAGWTTALDAANNLQLFNRETDGWKSAPVGALIFFDETDENEAGHVGIYTGDGEITEAYGAVRIGTKLEDLSRSDVGSYIGWAYPPESWRPSSVKTTTLLSVSPEYSENDEEPGNIDEESWYQKGLAFMYQGEYDHAIECFDNVINLDGQIAVHAWHCKGNILDQQGKYDEAIECFDKVIELDPQYDAAFLGKGNALSGQGKYEEAIKWYDKQIEMDPQHASWIGKGNVLLFQGKYEEAIKCYDNELELHTYAYPWIGKGMALYEQGKYDKAIKAYDEAIKLDQNDGMAWFNKSKALKALGRTTEAEAAIAKAEELGYEV